MSPKKTILVQGKEISLISDQVNDYISLSDMGRYRDGKRTNYIIQNWMRTRSAIEFCGLWEQLNNPDFKSIEFDAFKNESGSNSFALTPQKWIDSTNAKGIISKSGRYVALLPIVILPLNLLHGSVPTSTFISSKNSNASKRMKTTD